MKISVALCTYNGERFLREQIDSILNQSFKVHEIVICDDQSSDGTLEILNEYKAQYPDIFQIHRNEINLRSVKNFEKAIGLCSGDIIFLSDQDDKWTENKVADYVDYFTTHPEIKALASNGYCLNENSLVEEKYSLWDVPQFLKEVNAGLDYYTIITHISNVATGASMAFRKELVTDILPFPSSDKIHHDEWIALISSNRNQFELLQQKYFYYRIHSNQQVGNVFFGKSEQQKKNITAVYNLNEKDVSFSIYKKRLRKLLVSYKKSVALSTTESKFQTLFATNSEEIKKQYYKTEQNMNKKFFIQATLLKISDKLRNKKRGID